MSKTKDDEVIKDYDKNKLVYDYENDNNYSNDEDDMEEEIELDEYFYQTIKDIYCTHKNILDYVVDNNLDLCEYMDIDRFTDFLIKNKIVE